ncbi:MAG: SPOR domain-containing protein [Pseudomonadales bacterium]
MHKILILLTLLITCAPTAADFESAANAYRNKDYTSAYQQFIRLAEAGDPRAQTVIGLMYKYGESVDPDLAIAFSWYYKAATQGYAPAQFSVGEMYADGRGVAADRDAAILWLTRAAKSGFARANERLAGLGAALVEDGVRVNPDLPWSKTWNFRLPNKIRDSGESPALPDTNYRVQLGAMGTRAGANRLWEWLTGQAPALFDGLQPIVKLAEPGRQRVYRVQTGPFENLARARDFCDNLRQRIREAQCLPLKQS